MKHKVLIAVLTALLLGAAGKGSAQVDDICREFGSIPSMDSPFVHVPYVFGRVTLKGAAPGQKPPKITVTLATAQNSRNPITVGSTGNYCFRGGGGGGTLIVEVGGVEVARRALPAIAGAQQREDFEIQMAMSQPQAGPAVVSARFSHPRNEKTVELYRKGAEAQKNKDVDKTIAYLREIVGVDPDDFVAWGMLGSLEFDRGDLASAETAFRRSIALKPEYTPVWINVGKMRVAQKQLEAAIEIFKHAASLDPQSARTFQLLGETYIQAKMGTLGVQALNEAIRLDPVGMAGSHLTIGRLYDLAGAKAMATKEYKAFLAKVPDYQDRKKLEKYIKENPE